VILAQEDERKRIARELHDSTGQSLTSLLVGLQNLRLHSTEPAFQRNIDELRSVVGRTLEEVRALAWQLRPAVLDDLGLLVAIQRYISDFRQRYQITVDFTADPIEKRLPGELETTVYRIIQEGLTNIARHAKANNASIMLDLRPNALRIIIEDDGIGFDPDVIDRKQSLGLQGIRERATLLEGTMTIEASPGNGASVFVELPLSQ
jgi:signal transduction histidine kinase